MVTSFISICLGRFGFSFSKLKWKTKNELQIWTSRSSYFENRITISFFVLSLSVSIETKIKTFTSNFALQFIKKNQPTKQTNKQKSEMALSVHGL